jgi:acyl carrier protein
MGRRDIATEVALFVKKNYLFDESKPLDHDQSLIASGIIDSTGVLELVSYIEGQYSIQFADGELTAENFGSIERIASFIDGKLTAVAATT